MYFENSTGVLDSSLLHTICERQIDSVILRRPKKHHCFIFYSLTHTHTLFSLVLLPFPIYFIILCCFSLFLSVHNVLIPRCTFYSCNAKWGESIESMQIPSIRVQMLINVSHCSLILFFFFLSIRLLKMSDRFTPQNSIGIDKNIHTNWKYSQQCE